MGGIMKSLKIASIFNSIQGEGKNCGRATTFVRVFTENCFPNKKRCKFCDTVKQEYYCHNHDEEELVDWLYEGKYQELVSITGGELFSLNLRDVYHTISMLKDWAEEVEIETNGAYFREHVDNAWFYKIIHLVDNINVSLKLTNSGVFYNYDDSVIYDLYCEYGDKFQFKFVVGEDFDKDMEEINYFVDGCDIQKHHVWLMAMTPCDDEHKRKIVDKCIEMGYNYSPRLHVDLFGEDCKEDK